MEGLKELGLFGLQIPEEYGETFPTVILSVLLKHIVPENIHTPPTQGFLV